MTDTGAPAVGPETNRAYSLPNSRPASSECRPAVGHAHLRICRSRGPAMRRVIGRELALIVAVRAGPRRLETSRSRGQIRYIFRSRRPPLGLLSIALLQLGFGCAGRGHLSWHTHFVHARVAMRPRLPAHLRNDEPVRGRAQSAGALVGGTQHFCPDAHQVRGLHHEGGQVAPKVGRGDATATDVKKLRAGLAVSFDQTPAAPAASPARPCRRC
jgi:hypothetical protein